MNASSWKFFLEHAGYATPPGRAVCAASLAKAETLAESLGFTFSWEWDDDADYSWMDAKEAARDHEVIGCICRDSQGEVLSSLWGIFDPDRSYRRVVEAELASEALATYTPSLAGCP